MFDFSCRNTQGVYDKCMLDNLKIERPEYGYYCRAKVHHTDRPLPPKKEKIKYLDTPDKLPDDYPRPPAKYGSRFYWME
jgi:NADH dehydrogenase (ubiquinone) 1 alpha subcomplex subunit 8